MFYVSRFSDALPQGPSRAIASYACISRLSLLVLPTEAALSRPSATDARSRFDPASSACWRLIPTSGLPPSPPSRPALRRSKPCGHAYPLLLPLFPLHFVSFRLPYLHGWAPVLFLTCAAATTLWSEQHSLLGRSSWFLPVILFGSLGDGLPPPQVARCPSPYFRCSIACEEA